MRHEQTARKIWVSDHSYLGLIVHAGGRKTETSVVSEVALGRGQFGKVDSSSYIHSTGHSGHVSDPR